MRLQPEEILINNQVQTLVPGSTEWSYIQYDGPSWRDRSTYLYYKNEVVVHLLRLKHAYVCKSNHQQKFRTLQEVIETYQRYSIIHSIERWNQERGIVGDTWCQERGTPIGTLTITLPQATIEFLQKRVATGTLSQWIVNLIEEHLPADTPSLADRNGTGKRRPPFQEVQE